MDSKKIVALLSAVESGSLTAAAQELGYTQSGLTHMMNSLESELGLNLLLRNKLGVRLTPAGDKLLPELRALADAAQALEHSADKLRQHRFSTLRLGAYSSVARFWLPSILAEYRKSSPEIDVSVEMGSVSGIYDAVKSSTLDCAIVSYQKQLCQGLTWVPLQDDELLAILPQKDAAVGSFSVESFDSREFLMPSLGFDMDIVPVFTSAEVKVTPLIRYTNMDDASIISMVAHGLGISILSRLVSQGADDSVKTLPLSPKAYRQLGIIMNERQQNERATRRFIHCAQEVVSRMYSESRAAEGLQ